MEKETDKNQVEASPHHSHIEATLHGSKKRVIINVIVLLLIILGCASAYFFTKGDKGALPPKDDNNGQTSLNLPDCGTTKQLLKNSPVALADLTTIIPMGNFAPPGHIGPTPHMYYNYKNLGTAQTGWIPAKTNIYAPADLTVTRIALFDNASSQTPFNSYRIDFSICKQVTGYYIHTVTLEGKLADVMKPPYDNVQTSHISGTRDEHVYNKTVNVKLSAGELMGTGGGGAGKPAGLDFGLVDQRTKPPILANPARWTNDNHYVCSLDYYPPSLSKELYTHIGDYDFHYLDPGDPKCGQMYQDIPGTAQGVWFTPDQPKNVLGDPGHEITLAHSNLDHSLGVFSLGNKVDELGIESDQPLKFTPGDTVNVDFGKVKPDGKVYCYDVKYQSVYTNPDNIILLEMKDATHLRMGSLSTGTCGNGPWQMSAKYIDYVR